MTQQRYNDIDIYNNSSVIYLRKNDITIPFWITLLLIGSIIFVLISCFYKYTISNIYYAKIVNTDEENYLYMEVDEEFISLKNRNYIEINGEDYSCHLLDFSDKYYILNDKKYWGVSYECEIPEELNVNDNLVKVKIDKRKTTLLKEIILKVRKELKHERVKN